MVRLRVKRLLRERGMSVYRLAKELRLPPTTVYRLASGRVKRVDVRLVDRLCAVLGCRVADLFERIPDRPHKPTPRRRG